MKVYNINSIENTNNHILDPDYQYLENDSNYNLYHFFKQLTIPQNAKYLVGIYIELAIGEIIYENNSFIYEKFAHHIQEWIEKFLNFNDAELFNMNSNVFFLTMCDVPEEELVLACLKLNHDLNNRAFDKHKLQIRAGIYFSGTLISPFLFYQLSKEQFANTLNHNGSLVSVKYFSLMK